MSARNFHPVSIDIIHHEHEHLSAVIQGMLYFVRGIEKGSAAPDLKVFRAMLYYIAEYPEKVHHPKEDQYLFTKIRERTHQLDAALEELTEQHSQGERLVHQLQDALLQYEFVGTPAFPNFRDLVEQYASFYYAHMAVEEQSIMPIARQVLNVSDWQEVDLAFMENRTRLDQAGERYRYEQLFSLIVNISPAPIGVAEPL
ncbi:MULTISPECIES: hemerythrin domain-containing protein [unclassified Undibacterium]|uniref:hemerythrin domain-containing protein n=1 Tax=unclassified Undibacterium TaxID=2630295 RepID=UPI002AC9BE42|nr:MULTISPECIES: hemerythrin domain-containing protein [unclassified Undibacterium]MEB0140142.1 hemerythrin domain-containing protein [Undibacterium sp. CCC2.1]MEB0173590.1 hemerythrin domain-containing protein [Undibacterium sp. CCC1.1]MEB0177554.1 hemerythrin domain-containing protein [Undibacterium sp. CCC3.4]MEB0214443.1 hemerythrin domain-containing protein [Undibacterium sp. 5I2]WPX42840.1 hemerythrin domain-containing protein [Undibacterium sp. CCC3.4]